MQTDLIAGRTCYINAPAEPRALLLQPVGAQEAAELTQQLRELGTRSPVPFLFAGFAVQDWNRELSPWQVPPVFGKEGFGSGAFDTLSYVTDRLLPALRERYALPAQLPVILGGYSLAALFCLWSAYQTDCFSAVAAVSASVWLPGWMDFASSHTPKSRCVYLSLGDREELAKNRVLARVGDCMRQQAALFERCPDLQSILEWNEGNHFRNPALRCAKGFAWCLKQTVQR